MATDQELVEQVRRGDREAYAELFRKYYDYIYVVCLSMVKNPQDAEELAQEMGVDVLHVTLGYILCQPLNLYPLIGPRTSEELSECLGALNVELTSEQLAWLNLETSI